MSNARIYTPHPLNPDKFSFARNICSVLIMLPCSKLALPFLVKNKSLLCPDLPFTVKCSFNGAIKSILWWYKENFGMFPLSRSFVVPTCWVIIGCWKWGWEENKLTGNQSLQKVIANFSLVSSKIWSTVQLMPWLLNRFAGMVYVLHLKCGFEVSKPTWEAGTSIISSKVMHNLLLLLFSKALNAMYTLCTVVYPAATSNSSG